MKKEKCLPAGRQGFTLVEMLVVMAITAIVGTMLMVIFTNTLRGSNKAQILAVIKQNGQAVLDNMDKNIRGADNVICPTPSNPSNTLVIVKNGCYTRYKFVDPTPDPNPTQNGQIQQDNPQPDPSTPCTQNSPAPTPVDIQAFINNVCLDPMVNPTILTDTNSQTGVSIIKTKDSIGNDLPFFVPSNPSGFKKSVTIQFALKPGVDVPAAISDQIDPVTFQTTIELR
ncbi:MAG: type II secretion system protein [Candidatus Daviesbacteria bacterium]|nr:type II secretion system protein [Candidatus Daviesbacteria bacterium]